MTKIVHPFMKLLHYFSRMRILFLTGLYKPYDSYFLERTMNLNVNHIKKIIPKETALYFLAWVAIDILV